VIVAEGVLVTPTNTVRMMKPPIMEKPREMMRLMEVLAESSTAGLLLRTIRILVPKKAWMQQIKRKIGIMMYIKAPWIIQGAQ